MFGDRTRLFRQLELQHCDYPGTRVVRDSTLRLIARLMTRRSHRTRVVLTRTEARPGTVRLVATRVFRKQDTPAGNSTLTRFSHFVLRFAAWYTCTRRGTQAGYADVFSSKDLEHHVTQPGFECLNTQQWQHKFKRPQKAVCTRGYS
eukprot:1321104-Rhodomonas_salina.1